MNYWNQFPLFRLLLPFTLGILSVIVCGFDLVFPIYFLISLISIIALLAIFTHIIASYRFRWFYGALVFSLLFIFGSQITINNNAKNDINHFGRYCKKQTSIVAKITEPVEEREKSNKTIVEIISLKVDDKWQTTSGNAIFYFEKDSLSTNLNYGNEILCNVNLKARSLLYDVQQQKPTVNIKPGVFYNEIENYTIRIGTKEKDGMNISNIMIYDHSERNGNTNLTIAQYGKMEFTANNRYLIFTLHDGFNYYENVNTRRQRLTRPFQRTKFKEEIRRIDLSSFAFQKTDEELFKEHYQMLNISQLQTALDSLADYKGDKTEKFSNYIMNSFLFYRTLNKIITDSLKQDTLMIDTKNQSKDINTLDGRKEERQKLKDRVFPTNKLAGLKYRESSEYEDETDTLTHTKFNLNTKLKTDYLTNFTKTEKINIIESALNTARNNNSHIDWTIADMEANTTYISKHKIEWHRKFTLSFACFVLFFIGAPLGALIRKGGLGMPVVVSVIFFVIFHIISIIGEKAAKEGIIEPIYGMWLASAVLLPIGIFLTVKATTDSALLDTESWKKFIKRIFKK